MAPRGPTRSMTGFGRAEGTVAGLRTAVEVSTLNHRNRELHVHLPPRWSQYDPEVRRLASKALARGKVRVSVRIPDEEGGGGAQYTYRPEVADIYLLAYEDLRKRLDDGVALAARDLVLAPGVVAPREPTAGEDQGSEAEDLQALLGDALGSLLASREQEGAALSEDLRERLRVMGELLDKVEARLPEVRELLQARFRSRIEGLMQGTTFPEDRLLAEAALYVDRGDVHEELVRFRAHLEAFGATLDEGDAAGRRMAFLGQEMNREANTLGAKSLDPECSRLVVLLKDEVAKVREQVENLE